MSSCLLETMESAQGVSSVMVRLLEAICFITSVSPPMKTKYYLSAYAKHLALRSLGSYRSIKEPLDQALFGTRGKLAE